MKYLEIEGKKRLVTPLLMKPFLVSQSLKGIKTQTRRDKGLEEINENPDEWFYQLSFQRSVVNNSNWIHEFKNKEGEVKQIQCPYGHYGDILWVRETFSPLVSDWRKNPSEFVVYAAETRAKVKFKWKPNIHMPSNACRLFLEIIDVRPERLCDISEEDAKNEGVHLVKGQNQYFDYLNKSFSLENKWVWGAKNSFISLWDSINGKGEFHKNPWLWRIEYKSIAKPEGFDSLFPSKSKRKPVK